mmetsp:Transcript_9750/g.28607  ORF Transcript_9750/g.28607 Transcript_9750/m.28607 type:complete len:85 (-) Transcript_9750:547-801(-)
MAHDLERVKRVEELLVPMRGGGPGYADPEDERIKDMEAALKELEDWRRSFGEGKEGQQARAAGPCGRCRRCSERPGQRIERRCQ